MNITKQTIFCYWHEICLRWWVHIWVLYDFSIDSGRGFWVLKQFVEYIEKNSIVGSSSELYRHGCGKLISYELISK